MIIDPVDYFNSYYNLKQVLGGPLEGWQLPFIRRIYPFRKDARILLKAPRGARKSTTVNMLILDHVLQHSERFALIFTISLELSKEHLRTIRKLLTGANLYHEVVDSSEPETQREINFKNRSRITVMPQSETVVGRHPDIIFTDELARMKSDFFYSAIMPMSRGKDAVRIVASTPKGGSNAFYELWHGGIGWFKFDVPISSCPFITRSAIKDAKETMPEVKFCQEVLGQFVDSEFQVFKTQALENIITSEKAEKTDQSSFYGGLDLGRKHDYSALVILDQNKNVILAKRIKGSWEAQIEQFIQISEFYNLVSLCVDVSGVGDAVFELLRSRYQSSTTLIPFLFTAKSKEIIISHLIVDIEQERISVPSFEEQLIDELKHFEYISDTGESTGAASGYHDDLVIALALANKYVSSSAQSISYEPHFFETKDFKKDVYLA